MYSLNRAWRGVLFAGWLIAAVHAHAQSRGSWLVTPDEVAASFQARVTTKAVEGLRRAAPLDAPSIVLVQPQSLNSPLKAPLSIVLRFAAKDGAHINVKTLKVLYGFLKLDITSRLLAQAKVDEQGLQLDNAPIPAGDHRLVLQVADDKGRLTETDIRFSVQ